MQLSALLLAGSLIGNAFGVEASSNPNIWPVPKQFTSGGSGICLSNSFSLTSPASFDDLNKVLSRYQSIIFEHTPSTASSSCSLTSLSVTVVNPNARLQLDTDESYNLTIPDAASGYEATLVASTLSGAVFGLETFTQLIQFNFINHLYEIQQAPWDIQDAPQFPHRGILLDTSRHFQPLSVLKMFIDSLAMSKLNVFHWHISDDPSFPVESLSHPLLWMGAFSPIERYTQEDVAEIVEYARLRGVRTMIEFDVPGHAQSWCTGYPEVCPSRTCLSPLDPSTDALFNLLAELLKEMTGGQKFAGLFPETLIHLGGDEVDTSCWTSTPRINNWLHSQNMSANDAYMYVVERAHAIVQGYGREPVNWDEVWANFGTKLDKKTIINVWRDKKYVADVANHGYRVLVSNTDVWYLDHLDTKWQQFYENDPLENISDPNAQKMVLGGETCMWGETVDPSDLFSTVWPRAAAAAERLWSPPHLITNTGDALNRLEVFRCLLNDRGITAAPTLNANARSAPPHPGGCLTQ